MAYIKLIHTILCHGDNKYEIYAKGEQSDVKRIIHYKLRTCKNNQGIDDKSESQWVVFDPDMPLPQDAQYRNATNVIYYLEKL